MGRRGGMERRGGMGRRGGINKVYGRWNDFSWVSEFVLI